MDPNWKTKIITTKRTIPYAKEKNPLKMPVI